MVKQTTNYRIVITLCHANGRAYACVPIHTHFPNIETAKKTITEMQLNDIENYGAISKRYDIYPFSRHKSEDDCFTWEYRNCMIHGNKNCNRFKTIYKGHKISNRQRLDKALNDIDRMFTNQEIMHS